MEEIYVEVMCVSGDGSRGNIFWRINIVVMGVGGDGSSGNVFWWRYI